MQRTLEMVRSRVDREVDEDELYEAMCRDAAENVGANLVSVWSLDDVHSQITSLYALDLQTGASSRGTVLRRSDFPTYFRAILEETVVCAPNARTHPITRELTASYFEPHDVYSLLDFIVHRDFVPVGVICCETKGHAREWTEEDQRYLLTLATVASFKTLV